MLTNPTRRRGRTLRVLALQGRLYSPVFDDATERFELPAELPVKLTELEVLATAAREAFEKAYATATEDGKNPTAEEIEELTRLRDAVTTVEAAAVEVEDAEQARADQAAELAKSLQSDDDGDNPDEGDKGEGDQTPADDANKDDAPADDANKGKDDAPADDKEPALVAGAKGSANRRRPSFAGLNRSAGRKNSDAARETGGHPGYRVDSMVPGTHQGFNTSADLAELWDKHAAGRTPRQSRTVEGMPSQSAFTLGTLDRGFPEQMVGHDDQSLMAAVDFATDESNLKTDKGEGSLVAAGGWCAASETIYDFLGVPAAGDLLDLPEVGIRRGGLRWPVEPDFGAIYDATGWLMTEAEAIDQVADKPCFEVPCAGMEEIRLDAIGLCITAGLLQVKGYPEIVKRYIDGAMVAHQHKLSKYKIDAIVADSTPITIPAATTLGAAGAFLNSVELAAEDIRTRHRLPSTTTVEVVTTTWARAVIRADLAYRRGVGTDRITDQDIAGFFADRKARVQFISDWQTGGANQPGAAVGAGGVTALTSFPTQIKFAVYTAGTWFSSLTDVIEIGALYDKAQLQRNKYTALFTEDGIAVGKRGVDSRVYTVTVRPDGSVGAAHDLGYSDVVTGA